MRTLLFLSVVLAVPAGAMESNDLTYSFKSTTTGSMAKQQLEALGIALDKLAQCQKSIAADNLIVNTNTYESHILKNPILANYVKLLGPRIGFKFNTIHLENIEYHLIKAHIQNLTLNLTKMQETINALQLSTPLTDICLIDSGPITLADFIKCCD